MQCMMIHRFIFGNGGRILAAFHHHGIDEETA